MYYPCLAITNIAGLIQRVICIAQRAVSHNTKESIEGTVVEGKTMPGVRSPLSPEAMSVFSIDLASNKVTDKFKNR